MTKKAKSTYDEFIEAKMPQQQKAYENGYQDFLVSEIILAKLEKDAISVRKLQKLAGVSPTVAQDVKSGLK